MSTTPVPTAASSAARSAPSSTLVAWYLYDVAISVIDSLMITFVFSTYLTSSAFGTPEHATRVLSTGTAAAAVGIAVFAPLVGRLSDRSGRRAVSIAVLTGLCVLATVACFFVAPDEQLLFMGVALLCLANTSKELANVDYYSVLPTIAAPDMVGRVSGRGWGAGYLGSILATAFVLFAFVTPNFLNLPTDDAFNVRAVALFCAAWTTVFAVPVVVSLWRRERAGLRSGPVPTGSQSHGVLGPYKEIWQVLAGLWRTDRVAVHFLAASAIFRDGLVAMFTFGGVLAAGTFGFSLAEVMAFALAANVVAGVGSLIGGQLDDVFGPKRVIVAALCVVTGFTTALLFLEAKSAFWICGLFLAFAVGPAQASSRAYLARLTTEGSEGSLYGLYSTTGRAVSFLAPMLFGVFITITGTQRWGVLGILAVLVAGLLLTLPLPDPRGRFARTRSD